MKATAVAPANIAFIKYWGKKDQPAGEAGGVLRLPLNDSFSMNLSGAYTTTTVEFSDACTEDVVEGNFSPDEQQRIVVHLDRIRARAGMSTRARIATKNNFPTGAGIASSASGFAALTVAAAAAAGLALPEKDLTILARLGSGSACRSIPDGFVQWIAGDTSDSSFARSVYPADHWDISDIVGIVAAGKKSVGSGQGMDAVRTSPKLADRLESLPGRIERFVHALQEKNFTAFGEVIEEECFNMHAVMQSQVPPLVYWNDETRMIMDAVRIWRQEGLPVYVTIDAGPNVHLICEGKDEDAVVKRVQSLPGVVEIIKNKPAGTI